MSDVQLLVMGSHHHREGASDLIDIGRQPVACGCGCGAPATMLSVGRHEDGGVALAVQLPESRAVVVAVMSAAEARGLRDLLANATMTH